MTQDQPVAPFDWFANQFTPTRREEFIEKIYPHLRAYLKGGDRVVDLDYGAGSITIFLGEKGARISSIDLARSQTTCVSLLIPPDRSFVR